MIAEKIVLSLMNVRHSQTLKFFQSLNTTNGWLALKCIIIVGAIIAILLGSGQQIAATSTGFAGDDFTGSKSQRPLINPDFDSDESCLFNVYQEQCIPGSEQECPEGFGTNEDATCYPKHDRCPDGYHDREYDETGQCYSNEDGCEWPYYIMLEREDGSMTCNVDRSS